eukprot:TRINITY_DN61396_c0_g1_i1.p1 TRINITY_DN61396_c0_g1~~TRINITY_DN61396_c0_g1_i1.p1  ORF type:complete len:514 (-),score=104.68 TRINITY_DN61396_c0_g1_i1:311-1852(-)
MFNLKSLAKSTFGELKGALTEADDSEEEEEDEQLPNSGGKEKATVHAASSPAVANFVSPPVVVAASEPCVASSAHHSVLGSEEAIRDTYNEASESGGAKVLGGFSATDVGQTANLTRGESMVSDVTHRHAEDCVPVSDCDAQHTTHVHYAALISSLQGQGTMSSMQLTSECLEARSEFEAMLSFPGLREILKLESKDDPAMFSVPQIAKQCAHSLRLFAPRILTAHEGNDAQRLLTSFSERYDSLLQQYEQAQQRCKELSAHNDTDGRISPQQAEMWQAAHRASTERVEALSSENADLKERLRAFDSRSMEPAEKRDLLKKLAQRDADVRAAGDALRQLQEVMEDGVGSASQQNAQLLSELASAREELAAVRAACEVETARGRDAQESSAAAVASYDELRRRCDAAESEARDTNAALESLLKEKESHLEERGNFVDRRLVTSMLALYQDHLASGYGGLAEQVLEQTLQIMGGLPALTDRQRIHAIAERSKPPPGPLSDAFVDFLTKEAEEGFS